MDDAKKLKDRWTLSPWRDAISVLLDPNCSKEEFSAMVRGLYPDEGSEIRTSVTHRGKAELHDFRYVNLSKNTLENVDFYKFDLSGGDFAESNIDGANFGTAQLENANFSNVVANHGVNFHGCFAKCSDFSGARLNKVDFSGSDFSGADFVDAILENCDLSNAIFQDANLDNARIINCDAQKLRLSRKEQTSHWFQLSTFKNVDQIIWVD